MMTRALAALLALVLAAAAGEAGATNANLAQLVGAAPGCEPARKHCIGIKLHVAVVDAGPVATASWIAAQIAEANRHFEPLGVGFQIVGAAPLPASAARIEDAKERTGLAKRVAGTVIDVFVTARLDDIDVEGAEIRGVAWPAGGKKFVIISTIAPDLVLSHELGHVFGLPHSAYSISIMNKTPRKEPPWAQRTFHADELAIMRARLARMLRDKVIVSVAPAQAPGTGPATARP